MKTVGLKSAFKIAGSIFEMLLNAVEDAGGNEADLRRIETDSDLRRKLADLIVGTSVPTFSRDMRKEGWTLLENRLRRVNPVSDLELVEFLKSGESSISGEEMVCRASKELDANLGQEDAEWLLEHQSQIPVEWRKFYISFPGTVWQVANGNRYVPSLDWYDGRWCLYFCWLELDWGSDYRVLRLRK